MPLYTADALVLRTYKLGESDRIVVFLTEDRGKKRGVAKGARRPKSKFVGALEPLTRARIAYFEKERRELVGLNYAEPARSPLSARPEALGHVGYFAELLDEWAQEAEPNERLYRLGASLVDALAEGVSIEPLARYFEFWLLRLMGVYPPTLGCQACGVALHASGVGPTSRRGQTLHLRRVRGRWPRPARLAGGARVPARRAAPAAPRGGLGAGDGGSARGARGRPSHADGTSPQSRAEINTRPAGPAADGAGRAGANSGFEALTFQDLIPKLSEFWASQGCLLQQPLDLEVGAGTLHPETFLRVLGPQHWSVAYVQPSRRPDDGRFGENPNRLFKHHQFQVILKPAPDEVQHLYLDSRSRRAASTRGSTTSGSRRTTGSRRRSARGASAGRCCSTAWRSRSSPTSSRPAASTSRRSPARSPTGSSASRWRCSASTTCTTSSGRPA